MPFLENQVGCHWLDRNTDVIPARPTLTLPDLQIQGQPTFWGREFFFAYRPGLLTEEMGKQALVGAALGVIVDGEIAYLKGYGLADREAAVPNAL